jgi:hypothetical protein
MGLAYTPRSFRLADFRGNSARLPGAGSARFYGTYLHGERILFQNIGVVAIGAEVGIVGRNSAENYSKTLLAMQSVGFSANYRGRYLARQWVVPYARIGGEFLRYNYRYNSNAINGYRLMPRAEGGLELFLNFLDESSAGNMYGNHGVMRTYLYGAYSVTQDSKKEDDLNLSDRALRFGLRVEF